MRAVLGVAKVEGEREGQSGVVAHKTRQAREREREKNKKRWSNGERCGGRGREGGSSEASEQ